MSGECWCGVEYAPLPGTTFRDSVTCNYCGAVTTVEPGADECPHCGHAGALRWTDPGRQEVTR